MKYENINSNTIKISLTFEDLTEHDVKLSDFFNNQEVIEQLFYELVDELGLESRFTNTGFLTFQVQPHPRGVHLIVSEEAFGDNNSNNEIPDEPEEFEQLMNGFYNKLNEISASMAEERGIKNFNPGLLGLPEMEKEVKEEPETVFYSIRYNSPMTLLAAAKNVNFQEEVSELYRYEDDFYLVVLDSIKERGKVQVESMRARLMEYGEATSYSREFLQEYGENLISTGALDMLRKV